MLSTFIILGLTGLPQKFSTSPISIAFVGSSAALKTYD